MKRILSSLLVAALVVLMTAGSLGTASAEQPAAASIEASDIDLPFPPRATDVDDLILNTLGVAVGYAIYAAFICLNR